MATLISETLENLRAIAVDLGIETADLTRDQLVEKIVVARYLAAHPPDVKPEIDVTVQLQREQIAADLEKQRLAHAHELELKRVELELARVNARGPTDSSSTP